MPKAHIKTANGTDITIDGSSDEIAKIISHVQGESVSNPKPREQSPTIERKKEIKKQRTASDLIVEMEERGFFSKPQTLGSVAEELQKEGRLTPITTLSGVMLSLVQKKILSRMKKDGHWVYGRR